MPPGSARRALGRGACRSRARGNYEAAHALPGSTSVSPRLCLCGCGTSMDGRRPQAKWASNACKARGTNGWTRRGRKRARKPSDTRSVPALPTDPMSEKQRRVLADLCAKRGEPFNPHLTRGQARWVIRSMMPPEPSRADVRAAVSCPKCAAPAGTACRDDRGMPRARNHIERVSSARAAGRFRSLKPKGNPLGEGRNVDGR